MFKRILSILFFLNLVILLLSCSKNGTTQSELEDPPKQSWEARIYVYVHNTQNLPIGNTLVKGGWYIDEVLSARTNTSGFAVFTKKTAEPELGFDVREVSAPGYDTRYGYPIASGYVYPEHPVDTISVQLSR